MPLPSPFPSPLGCHTGLAAVPPLPRPHPGSPLRPASHSQDGVALVLARQEPGGPGQWKL